LPDAPRLHFVASGAPEAQSAYLDLVARHGQTAPEAADIVVALGGDGLMLRTLHDFMGTNTPIFGMNRGSVGFLMNEYAIEDLPERLAAAETTVIRPLAMDAVTMDGITHRRHAINEVSMLRQTYQAAHLEIAVDGRVRLAEMVGDGILVATPAGSTAYNLSVRRGFARSHADLSVPAEALARRASAIALDRGRARARRGEAPGGCHGGPLGSPRRRRGHDRRRPGAGTADPVRSHAQSERTRVQRAVRILT
jgi:hypothetical protein